MTDLPIATSHSSITEGGHVEITDRCPAAPFDPIGVRLAIAELRRWNAASSVDFIPAYGWESRSDLHPSDILQVDFGCERVDSDGAYLVEMTQADGGVWRGLKRFFIHPQGLQHKHLSDEAWSTQPEQNRVIGRATSVYRMKEAHRG